MDTWIALHKLHAYCTGVDTRLNGFRKVRGRVKENEIFTTPARPSTSQVITGVSSGATWRKHVFTWLILGLHFFCRRLKRTGNSSKFVKIHANLFLGTAIYTNQYYINVRQPSRVPECSNLSLYNYKSWSVHNLITAKGYLESSISFLETKMVNVV